MSFYTAVDKIPDVVSTLRKGFRTGATIPLDFRRKQLWNFEKMMAENEQAFLKAVEKDLHKCQMEAICMEMDMIRSEIADCLENMESWAAPRRVKAGNFLQGLDSPHIRPDPLGVVLVIGAWNYPIQLGLLPCVSALAAGNTCILKPSEVSPHTAKLIGQLVPQYFDESVFQIVNGAVKETTELLKQRFDHILYTGGGAVGRIVMKAASEHLTPVTLELGGKSPAIIHSDADLRIAGRRIAWGRFANCGQTCIAPDYVLCHPSQQDQLIKEIAAAIKEFYGEDPQKSPDYGRVVNSRHFTRLMALLAGRGGGKIAVGGKSDEKDLYIEPTVVKDAGPTSKIMTDEIFGPLLPIVTVKDIDAAIDFVNDRDKPLALYLFANDKGVVEKVLSRTSSGGAIINDTLLHCGVPELPFGGVGGSGMGAYHGEHGFRTFSHQKAYLMKDQNLEFVNALRYPPYSDTKLSWVRWLLFKKPKPSAGFISKFFTSAVVLAGAAFLGYGGGHLLTSRL